MATERPATGHPSPARSPLLRSSSLEKITPPKDLSKQDKLLFFDYFFRQLATFRNTALLYAETEAQYEAVEVANDRSALTAAASSSPRAWTVQYGASVQAWAQGLARNAWVVCSEESEGQCLPLDLYIDTSVTHLVDKLPSTKDTSQLVNAILFVHITTTKQYSARTRAFLSWFRAQIGGRDIQHEIPGDAEDLPNDHKTTDITEKRGSQEPEPWFEIDEEAVAWTLKHPQTALEQAQKQAEAVTSQHAERNKILRGFGVSLGAIAGGVLVGVTGGLAAPLVGAGVATVLGWLGVGGTVLGLLASGLAGSGVVCAALFGAYGAKSTAAMVERHTREVRDLAIVPVERNGGRGSSSDKDAPGEKDAVRDTLGVRLCVSGWLNDRKDITDPWTVFGGDDTFALQWASHHDLTFDARLTALQEIEALGDLANALQALIQAEAFKYVKGEIIKRTIFAGIMASLAPLALLRIGEIIDNPWMNARALGIKAGAVLGELLAERAFGNRPVTLVGYSLGSLVIYEALLELAARPPSETVNLIQDVYLFGSPVPGDADDWSRIRRVVAGRVVNGYSDRDYVLAVLSRAADATWNVAGLGPVDVKGVENINCSDVAGHTMWRSMVGKYLKSCRAPGILVDEVDRKEEEATEEQKAGNNY